jgi:hypothetical protein
MPTEILSGMEIGFQVAVEPPPHGPEWNLRFQGYIAWLKL